MRYLVQFIFCVGISSFAYCQSENNSAVTDTTLAKKEQRKSNKEEERKQLKKHVYISANLTYAKLQSQVSFEHSSKLFRAQIDLEEHLGLDGLQWFSSFNLIYRITPMSGLFSVYYGLHRDNSIILDEDIVYRGDTLRAGSSMSSFFNTNVISLGYLLSILKEEKAFLGAYFNVFVMKIDTGIKSDAFDFNEEILFFAPLPNFGLLMIFEFTPWLNFTGNFGFFHANIDGHKGSINDIGASVVFSPTPWLGLSLGYNVFDVLVEVPDANFRTVIEYNYSGPNLGLTLRF